MEQRSTHLGKVTLKRSAADRRIAHVCLTGAVRDVAIQAVGALDLVTDEVTETSLLERIKARSRLVILSGDSGRLERSCQRIRAMRTGWTLTIVLVDQALSDRAHSARLCQRLSADIGLPPTAPRALFVEKIEAALMKRAPLADFGVLRPELAGRLDTLFGEMSRRDYYGIFGVQSHSDAETIRQSFHRLAELTHPDGYRNLLVGNELLHRRIEKIYKGVSEAHNVLDNPVRRVIYDLCLRARGTLRYDPEALGAQARRELSICESESAKLALAQGLVARSLGDWQEAERAVGRAIHSEPQNVALEALLASVSSVRSIADRALNGRRPSK